MKNNDSVHLKKNLTQLFDSQGLKNEALFIIRGKNFNDMTLYDPIWPYMV